MFMWYTNYIINILISSEDRFHGTAVTSIIVDGPTFNPKLEDNCGHFKRIEDITNSKDDEIRFIMNGTIDEYETYTYNIPVPQVMNAHPFFAKATLAYFPTSDRNQGVDYTSTELDLHFGRIMEKDGKAVIKAIDYNRQADEVLFAYPEILRKNTYSMVGVCRRQNRSENQDESDTKDKIRKKAEFESAAKAFISELKKMKQPDTDPMGN